jgi:hypothetical protein
MPMPTHPCTRWTRLAGAAHHRDHSLCAGLRALAANVLARVPWYSI